MATTLSEFITALQDITVAGVKRFLDAPPGSLTTADMPAMWIQKAATQDAPIAKSSLSFPTHSAEIWLVIGPVAQSTAKQSFTTSVDLADALRIALRAGDLAIGQPTVAVRTEALALNEKAYWGVVATVEAQG